MLWMIKKQVYGKLRKKIYQFVLEQNETKVSIREV